MRELGLKLFCLVLMVISIALLAGTGAAHAMEVEWCFHNGCRGINDDPENVEVTLDLPTTGDLVFRFRLAFVNTEFDPGDKFTFLEAQDEQQEVVFDMSVVDLGAGDVLVLDYLISPGVYGSLPLGTLEASNQIKVTRAPAEPSLTVELNDLTYTTGPTALAGPPSRLGQGVFDAVGIESFKMFQWVIEVE